MDFTFSAIIPAVLLLALIHVGVYHVACLANPFSIYFEPPILISAISHLLLSIADTDLSFASEST